MNVLCNTEVLDLSSDEDAVQVSEGFQNQDCRVPPPPPLPLVEGVQNEKATSVLPRSCNGSSISRAQSSQDLMQEELKEVLTLFREKKPNLEIVKTPDVFISQKSSPFEVQKWLQAKAFNEKICRAFKGMTGYDILSLSRSELEKYCGKEEGWRLDSQLTIQRNVSGYKTARSSELRDILAKARKKVEMMEEQYTEGTSECLG